MASGAPERTDVSTLQEHADCIKAAIKAAESEGFGLRVDLIYEGFGPEVAGIDLDIFGGSDWITIFSEDRT